MSSHLFCICSAKTALQPVDLAPGLPALTCEACKGHLLKLDDYRRWIDRDLRAVEPLATDAAVAAQGVQTAARRCPSCTHLMQRMLSGSAVGFRVDRCSPCQLLWMDKGEWEAMVASGAAQRLLEVLSDGGQRQLRDEAARQRREAELRARHGDEAMDELIRIRHWLATQPQADTLLALLRSGW